MIPKVKKALTLSYAKALLVFYYKIMPDCLQFR